MEQGQSPVVGGEVGAALCALAGDLDTLTGAPLWQLADGELAQVIRGSYAAEQRAAAVGVAALREAATRGLPTADGAKDAPRWYRGIVPVTPGQAQVRAGLADLIDEVELAPTKAAFVAGRMSVSHAWGIARTMTILADQPDPDRVPEKFRREAQELLIDAAGRVDAAQFGKCTGRMRRTFDPDAAQRLAKDEDAQEAAPAAYLIQDATGMFHLSATLSARAGACLQTALDPLAAPEPASDGTPDSRPHRLRMAQALTGLAELSLAARPSGPGSLPTRGGAATRLTITADLATVLADLRAKGTPLGDLYVGQPDGWQLSPLSVQTEACDAEITLMLTDGHGRALDVGKTRYPFPANVRQAIEYRDRHCTFPNCQAKAVWCHTHHLVAFGRGDRFGKGGSTSEPNGTLLCGHHHRYVHAKGWIGRIIDGRVVWRPPDPGEEHEPNAHTQTFVAALHALALRWLKANAGDDASDTG